MVKIIICIIAIVIGVALVKGNGFISTTLGSFIIFSAGMYCVADNVNGVKASFKESYSEIRKTFSSNPNTDTIKVILEKIPGEVKRNINQNEEPKGRINRTGISDAEVNAMLETMNLPKADTSYYEDKITIIRHHKESILRGDFPSDKEFEEEYKRSGCKWFTIGNVEYVRDGNFDRIVRYK